MILEGLLALALAVPGVEDAPAEERPLTVVETIYDRAAAHAVSGAALDRLAWCESRHDPHARGRAGERGLVQLHPAGLLRHFLAVGYSNPESAFESADYAARVMAGDFPGITMRHWSCWGR